MRLRKTTNHLSHSNPPLDIFWNDDLQSKAWHKRLSLTYLFTPWSRVLLEKLIGSAARQEIPRIFGTRRFLTVLHLNIILPSTSGSPQWSLSLHCKYNRKNRRQDFELDRNYYTAQKGIFSVHVRLQQHKSTHVSTWVYEMQHTGQ